MSRRRTPRGGGPNNETDGSADDAAAIVAREFSAFGGVPLASVFGGGPLEAAADSGGGVVAQLASLGLGDADDLVGLAAVPGVLEELQAVLGQDVQELVAQAAQALPAGRAEQLRIPAPRDLGLGALPPTEEMLAEAAGSALEAAAFALVALPAAVDLRPYMSPIRNQASRGTCVSFALTALNEYILRRRGIVRDLSEQHLYYEIKQIDGAPNDCGTWQAKAVPALQTRGECRESIWPYNPNPPCNNHGPRPAQARPDGLLQRLTTIQVPARQVAAYKSHMARQRPVTVSIPVYNSWYLSPAVRQSGRITMRVGNEPRVGGHAVCLVGYQDTPSSPGGGYFIVRNSWGTTWASQSPYGRGYGTIPYQYIANVADEAYTAAVPGIATDDVPDDEEPQDVAGEKSTITIAVGRNIKITIASS